MSGVEVHMQRNEENGIICDTCGQQTAFFICCNLNLCRSCMTNHRLDIFNRHIKNIAVDESAAEAIENKIEDLPQQMQKLEEPELGQPALVQQHAEVQEFHDQFGPQSNQTSQIADRASSQPGNHPASGPLQEPPQQQRQQYVQLPPEYPLFEQMHESSRESDTASVVSSSPDEYAIRSLIRQVKKQGRQLEKLEKLIAPLASHVKNAEKQSAQIKEANTMLRELRSRLKQSQKQLNSLRKDIRKGKS